MTNEPRTSSSPEPRDTWPSNLPDGRWKVARNQFRDPKLLDLDPRFKDLELSDRDKLHIKLDYLRTELDYLDDKIAEWEAKESKLDDVETGYWPAAIIALVLLLANDNVWAWWCQLSGPNTLFAVVVGVSIVLMLWIILIKFGHAAVRLNMGNALPDLRKIRRLYRLQLRELEAEQARLRETAPHPPVAPITERNHWWRR